MDDQRVPRWVRVGLLVALAPTQIVTGLWALFAPSGFFDDFPGFGPALVAAHPPFNSHLVSDAGAGFLATGVALVAAAVWGRRSGVYVALLAYLSLTVTHLLFHATTATGTSGAQPVTVTALSGGIVIALLLAWGARRRGPERRPETEPHKTVAVVTALLVVGVLGTGGAALASAGRSSGPDSTYDGANLKPALA